MTTTRRDKSARGQRTVPVGLPGWQPISALWTSDTGRLFPSEQSARWFIRRHRDALVEAGALALHTGRIFAHPERFAAVAERVALDAARAPAADARVARGLA